MIPKLPIKCVIKLARDLHSLLQSRTRCYTDPRSETETFLLYIEGHLDEEGWLPARTTVVFRVISQNSSEIR